MSKTECSKSVNSRQIRSTLYLTFQRVAQLATMRSRVHLWAGFLMVTSISRRLKRWRRGSFRATATTLKIYQCLMKKQKATRNHRPSKYSEFLFRKRLLQQTSIQRCVNKSVVAHEMITKVVHHRIRDKVMKPGLLYWIERQKHLSSKSYYPDRVLILHISCHQKLP